MLKFRIAAYCITYYKANQHFKGFLYKIAIKSLKDQIKRRNEKPYNFITETEKTYTGFVTDFLCLMGLAVYHFLEENYYFMLKAALTKKALC